MNTTETSQRKIPGIVYIFVSFIPWVIYWVSCGYKLEEGLLIALLFSLILICVQIPKKTYNFMDYVSALYFGFATIATYIFEMTLFIELSGILGYFALALMAGISLLIKRPFTLQVAKRDYPKIYWRDKNFILINMVITVIWLLIFLLNGIIHIFFGKPIDMILSNTLVAFGIAFSIIFPRIGPAYFLTREYKKFDWQVNVDPTKPKSDNEYDAIIIGSGIGGLTAGALLSKEGYKVLVLEQHYVVGGYCSSFRRKGFIFNAGVEDVSGLWEKGPVNYLLNTLGLERDNLFIRNTDIQYILNREKIDIPEDLDGLINLLSERFPEEKENIRAFFEDAKMAYHECYSDTDLFGVPLPPAIIVKVYGPEGILNYPKKRPHFYDWLNKTYKDKLDEYFMNEDLKKMLIALLGYIGTSPEKTVASQALTAAVAYYLYGGYFPRGGAQKFADALKDYIIAHGGKVLLRHKVEKILVENGKVVGVIAKGKIFKAPIIIANANAKTVFLELIDSKHLDESFIDYIKSLKMSPSAFLVFLGIDMDLSSYPKFIINLDEGYEVVILSNIDPTLSPEGKSSITILTLANYDDFPERGTEEYLRKKNEMMNELIKKVERIIPNLSKHIIHKEAATPKTFEYYTSMPKGAIYAFDQSIGVKRPHFKTPIKGLYLASASTFPGGGIEAVVISGIIAAHDILGWKRK
ncbi:MAG: NAD(P)/FAD-dependent oxidoreductase [Candidatus Odinarchaeota archaeon]|nr:NAD(P)/FAD-dependent oxidoreductase [Candidatus Odinarchaeota archaeon]